MAEVGIDLRAEKPKLLTTEAVEESDVELPVEVTLPGKDRAGVTTSQRDHDIRFFDRLGGQQLRLFRAKVDPDFGHDLNDGGVHFVGGRAAGADDRDVASADLTEECG